MPIQILPPQLANQIAAGEVVERPASVVKELVENALDAGASQIDIEIDKGGHKRILIRDNGKGINKGELSLALSRHATSKITNIDDLEAIVSLGFRGEALASISSVSRLTMTSKPADQKEAWSAIAEGLDMAVKVLPAAHPNGTSVEVLDLFFNTPARRKFLRAEKTEFSHIESLIKRIGLSRPDVAFTLKHNGKVVKRLRSQQQIEDPLTRTSNRIAEVINSQFVAESNAVSSHYDQVKVSVWVKQPQLCVSVNPAQYSFVNGRMMRDKLLQHAIRQAYGSLLGPEQQPEYVVFIELPAQDVDVNVHPAKHEVRFHYARLLHDFLVKTMEEALAGFEQQQELDNQAAPDWLATSQDSYQQAQAATEIVKSELRQASPNKGSTAAPSKMFPGLKPIAQKQADFTSLVTQTREGVANYQASEPAHQGSATEQYGSSRGDELPVQQRQAPTAESSEFDILFCQEQRYYFFSWQQQMWLIDAVDVFDQGQIQVGKTQLTPAPLLVPTRLKLNEQELVWCRNHQEFLLASGFETKLHQNYLIIKQVPVILRSQDSGQSLPLFVTELMQLSAPDENKLKALIASSKGEALSPAQKQQKLKTYLAENKLNLHKIATKLAPRSLIKGN